MANQVVKLKDGDNYLYPYANFMGIDFSNIITSFKTKSYNTTTYVATEDCILFGECANGTGFKIDDVLIACPSENRALINLPLKKGQSLYMNVYVVNALKIYGIKH